MKNFCVNPYYNLNLSPNDDTMQGYATPCTSLDLDNLATFKRQDLIKKFEQGYQPKECSRCWTDERNGAESKRQADNKILSAWTNKSEQTLYEERHTQQLLTFQYMPSNICNLACKMCDVSLSTRWYPEHNTYHNRQYKEPITLHEDLTDAEVKEIKILNILGGEPFVDKIHVKFLERLVENKNTELYISYTSNGQQLAHKQVEETLKHFSNIQLNLSIDGTDKLFEYIRWPGKWEKLNHVMDHYKTKGWLVTAYTTLSNMNVYYYDDLLEWILKNFAINEFKYQFVYEPNEFSVNVMPEKLKHIIIDKFNKHKFSPFLQPICNAIADPFPLELLERFKRRVWQQDKFRKMDPNEYVPEIIEYLY